MVNATASTGATSGKRALRSTSNATATNAKATLTSLKPRANPKKKGGSDKTPKPTTSPIEPNDDESLASWGDSDKEDTTNKHISDMNTGTTEEATEEAQEKEKEVVDVSDDDDVQDAGAKTTDEEKERESADVEMETESPSNSPVKKRSKREVLAALITPKPPKSTPKVTEKKTFAEAAKSKEPPTTTPKPTKSANRDKATKKAEDPPAKSPSPSTQATDTPKPASALKESKYKKTPSNNKEEAKKAPPQLHDHKHKRIIIDAAVDFGKAALAEYGDDNPKKLHFALTHLVQNINFADALAIIPHKDTLNLMAIGPSGNKVPSNLTQLSNYFYGINAKQLNATNNDDDDALSSLRPGKKGGGKGKLAYFSFMLSCDTQPAEVVNQVSLEWSRFGPFIRVKDLQALHTETPIVAHSLFVHSSKQILQSEMAMCLKLSQEDLRDNSKWDSDIPMAITHGKLPEINLRANVPMIPKQKTNGVSNMPRSVAACRRCIHLEVATEEIDMLKALVAHGKKIGIFKEIMGAHVHLTETVDWDSTPGDLKRAGKFHRDSTNYNACMTASEIHGFLDLNEKVAVRDGDKVLQRVSGRLCITSLLKFGEGSTLVAEVHQAEAGGVVILVYPNTPEAEALVINLMKNPAFFLKNYLVDIGVDKAFVSDVVSTFCDPALIHEGQNCQWVSETATVLTEEELEDQDENNNLESQAWFVDVVKQYEELNKKENSGRKGKNYAAAEALYDLDAERSVKTMHEKHDGIINLDETEEKSVEEGGEGDVTSAGGAKKAGGEEEEGLDDDEASGLQDGLDGEEASISQQSGYSPIRGTVRFNDENGNGATAGEDDSSSIESVTPEVATASAAGQSHVSSEAGKSG